MSESKVTQSVKVMSRPDRLVAAPADVKEFSRQEKNMRGLKTLGAFWGGAVVSILIPMLHFVLVPGLFLAGIIMANMKRKQKIEINDVKFQCPECQQPVEFKKISGDWPLRQNCPQCSAQLYFEKN